MENIDFNLFGNFLEYFAVNDNFSLTNNIKKKLRINNDNEDILSKLPL